MKICFVTATLTSGGSERVMSLVANQLAVRGHEVVLPYSSECAPVVCGR